MIAGFRSLTFWEKIQVGTSFFLLLTLVGAIVWSALNFQWLTLFISVLAFIASTVPFIWLKKRYHLFLPVEFQFAVVLFVYASLFLGELGFYERFWWWDMVLHTGSGFAIGFLGFLILLLLHLKGKFSVSPYLFAFFTFSFALSLGALWEIFEFAIDVFFDTNMQRRETGVVDTMNDLILDAIGALIASVFAYEYINHEKKDHQRPMLFRYLVVKFLKKNPKILDK